MTLAWDPSPDDNVAGYRIHYGFTPGSYTQALTLGVVTNATFDLPVRGETYYMVVTAYDTWGRESGHSNEVIHTNVVELGGAWPRAVLRSIRTPEERPVALPWGPDDGYATNAFWLTAISPRQGTVRDLDGRPVYVPRLNATGPDACTYFITEDPESDSPVSHKIFAYIEVLPVNDLPVAQDQFLWMNGGASVPVSLEGFDVDGDDLTFEVIEDPVHGTLGGSGRERVYEPPPHFQGTDSFRYIARDGFTNSEPATVEIRVEWSNARPFVAEAEVFTVEDTPVEFVLQGADPDGDELFFQLHEVPRAGTLVGHGADWTYEPDPDANGIDKFQFVAWDAVTFSEPALVTIHVRPVNDPPVAVPAERRAIAGVGQDLVLEANDVEGDPLSYRIARYPEHGRLRGGAPFLRYQPDPSYEGIDTVGFVASDGSVDSDLAMVFFEVLPRSWFQTRVFLAVEGDELGLRWQTIRGARYRLWRRDDLATKGWLQVVEVPPAPVNQETIVVSIPKVEGFYRCEVLTDLLDLDP